MKKPLSESRQRLFKQAKEMEFQSSSGALSTAYLKAFTDCLSDAVRNLQKKT